MKYLLLWALLGISVVGKADGDIAAMVHSLDSLVKNKADDKALVWAEKLEKQAKKEAKPDLLAYAYNTLARLHYNKKNYNKSISYFEQALDLQRTQWSHDKIFEAYYNLGSTCLKLNKIKKAIEYFGKSLKEAELSQNIDLQQSVYQALVVAYESDKDYKTSNVYLKKLHEISVGAISTQIDLYRKEAHVQKQLVNRKTGELKNTQKELGHVSDDLVSSKETIDLLEEDTLRKQKKISSLNYQKALKDFQLKTKNEELEQQKMHNLQLLLALGIVIIMAIFVWVLFMNKRRLSLQLQSQNEQIKQQREAITHSIEYASKIQMASLPPLNLFEQHFSDSFVFYRPRDIVSGDFYFLQKVHQYIVLAAVDCTGHGVPGAFMSMLGVAGLNDIIRRSEVTQANHVLEYLREHIKTSLQQTGKTGEQRDGMDMALVVIDTETMELQYAGAHRPILLVQNGQSTELKPDKMPVGVHRKEEPFNNQKVNIQKGDCLFLCSDGFSDQIGGENQKTFKSTQLKQLILSNVHLPMRQQSQILETSFDQWKAQNKQIDDVLIMGVKI